MYHNVDCSQCVILNAPSFKSSTATLVASQPIAMKADRAMPARQVGRE